MDVTQNYGAAFYSCAVGMGVGAICLGMVGPANSGMCQRQSRNGGEEETASKVDDQQDFLEVDFAPDNSPVRQAEESNTASVI